MRAVIPVAGFGTRLKPHTYSMPKVLLTVGDKPILGHILEKLVQENILNATLITGHLGDKIVSYVRKEFPQINAEFVEQEEMLGLGHAIYSAAKTFGNEEIFIILGDTVFDVNLDNVLKNQVSSIGVKNVEDPSRFGVAVTENGFVKKLIEKPSRPISKMALVGLYYIKNSELLKDSLEELIRKNIKTRGEYQLTDALQIMIERGEKITTFKVDGWYDCGKPETLLSTNRFLLQKNHYAAKAENTVVIPPVFIAENAIVENSVIGPFTTISKNCIVRDSIIKNSIINPGAHVERAMLDSSIIGSNAVVKGKFTRLNAGDSSELEFD